MMDSRIKIQGILRHYFKLDLRATEAAHRKFKELKQYMTVLFSWKLFISNVKMMDI